MSIQRKQLVHELQMCVIFKDSELFLFAGLSGYPLKSTDPKKDYLQSTWFIRLIINMLLINLQS